MTWTEKPRPTTLSHMKTSRHEPTGDSAEQPGAIFSSTWFSSRFVVTADDPEGFR